jgi:hypothetical protein
MDEITKEGAPTLESEPRSEVFDDSTLQPDADRRPLPPNAGKGRKLGVPNRVSVDMKALMVSFIEHNLDGAQALYDRVAKKNPARALGLLARFAGLVLPRQSQHAGAPLVALNFNSGMQQGLSAADVYKAMIENVIEADPRHPSFERPAIEAPVSTVEKTEDES